MKLALCHIRKERSRITRRLLLLLQRQADGVVQSAVLAIWDIHSNTGALTMSSTQIFASLSTSRARFSPLLISLSF